MVPHACHGDNLALEKAIEMMACIVSHVALNHLDSQRNLSFLEGCHTKLICKVVLA